MKEERTPQEEAELRKLYHSKPGTEEHQQHEQRYNEIRKQRIEKQPDGKFQYQKDVRHEFEYGEQKNERGEVTRQTARTRDGCQLRKSGEVINWRHTEVGAEADLKARRQVSRETGDDGGHLVSPELGADPGNRKNIARQNYLQNQGGGTWHQQEERIKSDVNDKNKRMGMSVEIQHNPDKHGDRPYNRKLGTWQQDEKGKPVAGTKQSVQYGNFTTEEVRARQDGTYQKGQSPQMRKAGSDHMREIHAKQESPETEKGRQEWSALKENRAANKDKMRARVVGGTEAKPEKSK